MVKTFDLVSSTVKLRKTIFINVHYRTQEEYSGTMECPKAAQMIGGQKEQGIRMLEECYNCGL